jgi:hypothetical protein
MLTREKTFKDEHTCIPLFSAVERKLALELGM